MNGDFAILEGILSEFEQEHGVVQLCRGLWVDKFSHKVNDNRVKYALCIQTNQITNICMYKVPDEWNITDSMYMKYIYELEKENQTSYACNRQ